ncbi:Uncharacterised protein [Mycobacterium tuberculosis]|uniref:Uncharacterized protein n=1 Tax=Mycobacterium tuberculosis TaxID=1773 RepID=A0A0U0RU18_MYCTX|nr:Uncharacterised protein [Mycobacterium tuberculosis]
MRRTSSAAPTVLSQSISAAIWPSLLRTDVANGSTCADQFARQRNQVINVPYQLAGKAKVRLGQAATYVADSADSVVGCTGSTSPYPQAWMMRATARSRLTRRTSTPRRRHRSAS